MSEAAGRRIGVVGLGQMGLGMATTLAAKGFSVSGLDLSPARRDAAQAAGIRLTEGIEPLFGEADFVLLSLPAARDVAAVLEAGAQAIAARADRRLVVIDTSTSEPDVSRAIAARLAAAGHGFLDAPVSGGPKGAASGTLAMMIGGAAADVASASAVTGALASKVFHVGESGAGNVAKLVNNMLVAAHMVTTREALALAEAAGVAPEAALAVVNAATGRSAVSEVHFPTWVLSERFDSGFSAGLMRKDVRLAGELAQRMGLDLPLAALAAGLWNEGPGAPADEEDFTRMGDPRVLRSEGGRE